MTDQELINYYANLLIIQYISKPKAFATIQAVVTPVIMNQIPLAVQNAFNIPTAVGVQLDTIGKYVGVVRTGYGIKGDIIMLNDADFSLLIQLAILTNNAGSSLFEIQNLLQLFFANKIYVFDYQTMRLSYILDSTIFSNNVAQLFVTELLLPKPMGVQLSSTIYTNTPLTFFGFRTYYSVAVHSNPFNDYASYQTNWPFLTYADALV